MSRPAVLLSAFTLGAVAVLAGCTSSGDASELMYPESVGPGNYTADPLGWVNDFCKAAAPLQGDVTALSQLAATSTDTDEWTTSAQNVLTDLATNLRTTAGNMDELGPPPISADAGDDLYNELINLLNTFADVFETASSELDTSEILDVDAPTEVPDQVASAVAQIKAQLAEQSGAITAAFEGTSLQETFAAAPECQGFEL